MELFHQTVSMKSVGNLNEFVRNHMLEPVDASERVKGIVAHFEDLTKAHDAVRRARDQLDALRPLVSTSDKYDAALARRNMHERHRDAVRLFFAELRIRLLTEEIAANEAQRAAQAGEGAETKQALLVAGQEREKLIADRSSAGGDRVSHLEAEAQTARSQASDRKQRRDGFDPRVQTAGLDPVTDAEGFAALTVRLEQSRAGLETRQAGLTDELAECSGQRAQLRRQGEETRAELTSLAGRTSNLPSSQLVVRAQLCQELGLDESDLPFAGELLDVADEFAEWRGAAERVLRGFALSLLVPQRHYSRVARWVNENRLTYRRNDGRVTGSRLVYERVAARRVPLRSTGATGALLLAGTLDIADGPFQDYLRDELVRRADYRCVESVEQFRDEHRAVTREGQVRSGDRHEKDDRSRVDDPRGWVLGWLNERKVEALTEQLLEQQQQLLASEQRFDALQVESGKLAAKLTALANLEVYTSWSELDWHDAVARAEAAEAERQRLADGSSALAEIERRLAENAEQTAALQDKLTELTGDVRVLEERIKRAEELRQADQRLVGSPPTATAASARASYSELEVLLGSNLPTESGRCAPAAESLTTELQATIDRIGRELGGYTQSMLQYMSEVRRRWPEATTEMDADIDARGEFRAFHDRVATDDLPRFENEFKRQLNTNTIRELAQFNNWLRRQSDEIHSRVARINEALGAIDYSPGRYITLVAERTINQEVQNFRSDLRTATDDTLTPDDDQYSEQRFLEVQRIIDRFRGRDGHADADKAWTRRVTDVRNWFTFSASERDRETNQEWEHYRDSDGKSGGQKEKLAYTILAASLAYQFGLEWGAEKSKDFRFAVIDEAFGRGSDGSTRYALELFAKLGLQLLIVTPLQKVHVIEPYVHAIGFVDNPTGSFSRLQTLTIEEFRQRREGRPA
ncbi:ATP-binding protein [Kribbella sp. CA-294648]|uniref:ATP-binding protein n=1 Tax=Kribbella sp. CA-294648 TaxID=3239948 RepID=UPI003D89BDDA